jgi:hypothetical protein
LTIHESVFAAHHGKVWKYRYGVTLHVTNLTGGFPLNPAVIEGWLKSKIADNDDLLRAAIAENMMASAETQAAMEAGKDPKTIITPEDAVAALAKSKSLKGFKRDADGLYIEGRQVKAMLKEGLSVAVQGGHIPEKGWGLASNKKWLKGFAAEHIIVPEDRIYIYVNGEKPGRADEVRFDFVHASGQHGFKQSEVIWDAEISFTVETDFNFAGVKNAEEFWQDCWVVAEQQGLGSDRSQGQGRFVVTRWELLK